MSVKVGLEIKNGSKVFKPKAGDTIIFDGKEWYVTRKEDLLSEAFAFMDQLKAELALLKEENANFKVEIAEQMLKFSKIIEKIYKDNSEVQ